MTILDSEEKLVQSIIDKKGDCLCINCSGGNLSPLKIGKKEVQAKREFSNLGIPCPLKEDCKDFDPNDDEPFLKLAKKWMRAYNKKMKKENKNEN